MQQRESLTTLSEHASMGTFWFEIAKSGDPFACAMVDYRHLPGVENVDPKAAVVIGIDEQPAFMPDGGLSLDYGDQVVNMSQKILTPDLFTVDYHSLDNIGNASAHRLPPFSLMYLRGEQVAVVYPDGTTVILDQNRAKSRHTLEEVKDYLTKQATSRLLTALLLGTEVYGVGQVLWPNHANNYREETKFIPTNNPTIFKGQKRSTDSYSFLIEGNGEPVLLLEHSSAMLVSKIINQQNANNIIFTGLAGNYCVLYSAESARLAQEIAKLFHQNNNVDWTEIIHQKLALRKDIVATDEQIELMVKMLNRYVEVGMMLDPKLQVCVALDHTDVVRGLGGINSQEDVNQLIQLYLSMGVKLVTL